MKTTAELLASNLRDLRKARGWSQEKLSEFAQVDFQVVQRAEGGTAFPRQDKLTALAAALGVPESRLFLDPEAIPTPTPKEALAVLADALGIEAELRTKAPAVSPEKAELLAILDSVAGDPLAIGAILSQARAIAGLRAKGQNKSGSSTG